MVAYTPGLTALVALFPAAGTVVQAWRAKRDPAAERGVPAHVTVLFPFLPEGRIDDTVLDELAEIFQRVKAFEVKFGSCGRFSDLLYLAPEPAEPFRALTAAVAARWPEAPPYGGAFPEVVPHLTVANDVDAAQMDEIEADLSGRLPVHERVEHLDLYVFDGATWRSRRRFPLG
jgi:2'-5' RNA ligase